MRTVLNFLGAVFFYMVYNIVDLSIQIEHKMTKRTKTDLIDNIIEGLLLDNDGGEISPGDLRTGFIDTADSVIFWDNTAPASVSESCIAGTIKFADSGGIYFLYVCVATDTWRRAEMTSF